MTFHDNGDGDDDDDHHDDVFFAKLNLTPGWPWLGSLTFGT